MAIWNQRTLWSQFLYFDFFGGASGIGFFLVNVKSTSAPPGRSTYSFRPGSTDRSQEEDRQKGRYGGPGDYR